ncbi:Hsp70 family protein [Microbacterium sp. USHLN186]|uniref:Hsp70 family protein n=1 Tax=Microbacterium sp. USHLN186 TaxID=3081286 RepID=UPI00301A42FB
MGTAELLLALDAGQTRLQAVLVSAGAEDEAITSHLRLGADRDHVSAGAFIAEDGDVLFGDEAERRGAAQPERLVRDFFSRVGDRAPVVVGGFAVPAEELVTRMVRWAVAVVVAQYGVIPGCIALAHPTGWRGHRIQTLRAALQHAALGDVLLVPAGYAAARHAASSGRSRAIAVYDLGGETFEASVLDGAALAGPPCVLPVGAADLDLSLLQHVISLSGGGTRRPGSADELVASRASVAAAKEELSRRSDAAVALRLHGREAHVRLTRAELEDLAAPVIERTVDTLEGALDDAGVRADQLDEIVLVGGGAQLPLVAQTLSRRMDRPLTMPKDPQFATALGAGLIAWERTADRRRARAAVVPPEVAAPERVPLLAGLLAGLRGARVPYGAAAMLVVAGVLIAGGMVFGATTMDEPTSAAADGSRADAGDDVGVRRAASGFSTAPSSRAALPAAQRPSPPVPPPQPTAPQTGGTGSSSTRPQPSVPTPAPTAPSSPSAVESTPGPQSTADQAPEAQPTAAPAPEAEPADQATSDHAPASASEPVEDPSTASAPAPQPTVEPTPPTSEHSATAEPLADAA